MSADEDSKFLSDDVVEEVARPTLSPKDFLIAKYIEDEDDVPDGVIDDSISKSLINMQPM